MREASATQATSVTPVDDDVLGDVFGGCLIGIGTICFVD